MDVATLSQKWEQYVIDLRRWFHKHPELSYQEEKTSARVCEELDKLGIPYTIVPPYGVVATLACAKPGKTLVMRADFDALPIHEEGDPDYISECDGVMHACGHDGHAAMLLGAAAVLNEMKGELAGTVKFCFQSAEEIGKGAEEMIAHLQATGGADQVVGLHVMPDVEQGTIALMPGIFMAGILMWEVVITGKGGHGSRPDRVHDPIKAACEVVLKYASIPSNFYNVLDPCVVTSCLVQAGSANNVFPDSARIEGTVRYFQPNGAEQVQAHMRRMLEGICLANGVQGEAHIRQGAKAVFNNPELVAIAQDVVNGMADLELAQGFEPMVGSDNFGDFIDVWPGFYGVLGVQNTEKGITGSPHQTRYEMDESALRKGVAFFAGYAQRVLQ